MMIKFRVMHIRVVEEGNRSVFDEFVAKSSSSPILQSYEWGEFKGEFGWNPIRIAIVDEGEIRAGISILKRKIPLIPASIFYAPRGPVVDFADEDSLNKLLIAIALEAKKHRAIYLKIDPEMEEGDTNTIKILVSKGFKRGRRQIQPRSTHHLDLTTALDELLKNFEEKTRYNIRLAEKKGVKIEDESNLDGVQKFYNMYKETAERDNFLIHPFSYYKSLKKFLIDKGLAKVFVAYYKGVPIASVFIFTFGDRVTYMYGASTDEYRNVMPNHALHWHVIGWAKKAGFKKYDLWGIPANPTEGHPLWGVYRFKKGFRGKVMKFIGVYDLPFNRFMYNLLETAITLWQNFRSLITKGKIEDSLAE